MMAATMTKRLSCFEPTFERFATVSEDSRLKIYDTRSGDLAQQLTEKDHLSIQYSAIAWGAAAAENKSKRSKRVKRLGGTIALGTSKGTIVLWNLQQGEVHRVLGGKEGHSAKVNDLVFTEGATFLFSCSEDLQVIKWNVESGELVSKFKADNHPVTSMALSLDNATLASASTMIKVWDLASVKSQKKLTGHASSVSCLDFSPDGQFLLSSSPNERYTSVWNLEENQNEAAAVFTASSNPVHVEFNRYATAKAQNVLALLRSGTVGVWELKGKTRTADDEEENTPKSHAPDTVIKVKSAIDQSAKKSKKKTKQNKAYVVFAQFAQKHEIIVAYGKASRPAFQRVSLVDENTGQLKRKIVIKDVNTGSLITEEASLDKTKNLATNVLAQSQINPITKAGVTASENREKGEIEEDRKNQPDVTKLPANVTLQEQLERMQLTEAREEEESEDDIEAENMEAEADQALEEEVHNLVRMWGGDDSISKKIKAHQIAPKATSLASALGQAIHTKDRHLLENVLNIGQHRIIFATVRRLQPDHVLPFLKLVLTRFRENPNRSVALLVWIRAVLVEHVAYLSTVPALLTTLGDLHSTVQSRLANHKRYVKLAGRLELLNSQIQQRNTRSVSRKVPTYREDDDNGEDEGMTLMDALDMGEEDDEDEQDVMQQEDEIHESGEDEDEELSADETFAQKSTPAGEEDEAENVDEEIEEEEEDYEGEYEDDEEDDSDEVEDGDQEEDDEDE